MAHFLSQKSRQYIKKTSASKILLARARNTVTLAQKKWLS
jgi:hypothetical protein